MARQCAVIPKVLDRAGNKVDSKLFKDLLSYLPDNRSEVVRIYEITKGQDFIQKFNPRLTMDNNGEPTLRSLLKHTNLDTIIKEPQVLERLNREIGYYKKGMNRAALWIKNQENYKKLTDKARRFNQTSEFRDDYVAKIIDIYDNESSRVFMGVKVERRNQLNSLEADKMEYNETLNERLRDILTQLGVSVGALTELERRQGINGVTDFDQARSAAEGMVELIRLAEGERGERALPEEFAHFALEALGSDNQLANRLMTLITNNGLAKEIIGDEYDAYASQYDNDEVKLAKEAAGKLLARHLLDAQPIPAKPYKNLLERLITSIKNFFKGLTAGTFEKAMIEADKSVGRLAKDILEGSLTSEMDVKNIGETTEFYSLNDRIARDKQLLENIIKNEVKRMKVYEARNPKSKFSANQQLFINRLDAELQANNELEGINVFMENALDTLQSVSKRLASIATTEGVSLNEKARVLRDVRNYLYSYKHLADDIRAALVDEEKFEDNRYGERTRVSVDNFTSLLQDLFIEYNNVSMPLFVDFIKPFVGDGIVVPFGKFKGKKITAQDLLTIADDDISFFDRWLDSMADSSSHLLKIFDQALKQSKEEARLRTIDDMKILEQAHMRLEQAGVKNTEWMFERDRNGNLTDNYISEINWSLFEEKRQEMLKSLKEKYGENPVGQDAVDFTRERRNWYNANMETVGERRMPKKSIYESQQFKNLNAAQREYYNTVMDLKAKLDSYLPEGYTRLTNTIKIRKDLLERIKASGSIKGGATQLWENIKDQFIRRSDDTDFGTKATIKDFEDREVQTLPIYYTKRKEGESANDISTDVTSTMIAYAAMANDFDEMGRVLDVLELGRDIVKDNLEITKTRGGKPLVEKFEALGRTIESKVTKRRDKRYIIERLDDFFEMQVYSRYMADEGTFGKTNIDKGKVANFVNRMTSLNTLALNVLSGISNVATGKVMMRIESMSKEFFTEKNTIKADRIYGQSFPALLGNLGKRVKTDKLSLFSELFNVMQEYEGDVREANFDRKTWFSRMAGSSALFVMNNAGEHWMQHRTALALADAYKMKSPDGKTVSLWDALEVVYTDPNNKNHGAKLKVKQGYTKEDGSEFTNKDIIKFSRKAAAINQRMHGIYNKLDRSAVQRLAVGRMGMMFRKWIKPSLNRRYKSMSYNYDLGAWTEGYYNTFGRFLLQAAKELKEGQFALTANWKNLTNTEKANIKRAVTELGHMLAIALVLGLIDWSDDKDRPWLVKMAEYQARRLFTEIGSMAPTHLLVGEGLKIIKSPAAGVNTIENTLDLIKLMNPYNYETFAGEDALLQTGRFKGQSRATKLFFESPLIPMNKTVYRGLHPEESIPFFKQ